MIKLISHRGNINGKSENENSPEQIDKCISLGYDVEIDLWFVDNQFFLGHDKPEYSININWLEQRGDKLWIHCKNLEALSKLNSTLLNYFFHDSDKATLTSHGFMWVYPGEQPVLDSIAVLPEINNDDVSKCIGICSDFIVNYK